MATRRRAIVWLLALLLSAAACGGATDHAPETSTRTPIAAPAPEPRPAAGGDVFGVPDVVVRSADTELVLRPWTACWDGGCYDGLEPPLLQDIGEAAQLEIEFAAANWDFSALVTPRDDACAPQRTEPLARSGDWTHDLISFGAAGDYEVELFGHGPGGDVIVSFSWTIPSDGPAPEPMATAAILASHDGRLDSYGVEVLVMNLPTFPTTASGEATVTAGDGSSHSFRLGIVSDPCKLGFLYFSAPDAEGLAAAELTGERFTYTISLSLDDEPYVGTGVWPDDVDPECNPCVPLEFDPPLSELERRR